ncbi:Ig-like domain-containing protein [Vibrio lentus]|uniref:Ig-like domain-containing protein n=1 Tax=Vibrio lentus TaxID=136468 RepID=UPI000C81B92B|nr:Ig-like domain-containing protein [Vibrio lentus]PMM38776.1 hypothetical protein BCT56_26045 [Vibrio lentus]
MFTIFFRLRSIGLGVMLFTAVSGCQEGSEPSTGIDPVDPKTLNEAKQSIEIVPALSSEEVEFLVQNKELGLNVLESTSTSSKKKDVTSEVKWYTSDEEIATISEKGVVRGVSPGEVVITAEKGRLVTAQYPITVKTNLMVCGSVGDTDKQNALGACLKVAQGQKNDANYKLFTGSPSLAAMELLGYEQYTTETNYGKTYGGILDTREFLVEPQAPLGKFVTFRQDGKGSNTDYTSPDFGAGGQYDRFCRYLAKIEFFDKNDWRRAYRGEIYQLYQENQDFYDSYGWNAASHYWSASKSSVKNYLVAQGYSGAIGSPIGGNFLATCVSETL